MFLCCLIVLSLLRKRMAILRALIECNYKKYFSIFIVLSQELVFFYHQFYIFYPGLLSENVTSVSPGGEYQKWDGKAWVKDEAAEKAAQLRQAEETKSRLLQMASEKIAPLQDAVDLGLATDDEKAQLDEWKKYRVLVNRVDTLNPDWPEKPSQL